MCERRPRRLEMLEILLRAGSVTVRPEEPDRAAEVRSLCDEGLVCRPFGAPGSTFVITDGGRLAWELERRRARRFD